MFNILNQQLKLLTSLGLNLRFEFVRSGEWVLAGEGEKETPVQKYQRLKCEMEELLQEISQLKVSIFI